VSKEVKDDVGESVREQISLGWVVSPELELPFIEEYLTL